MKGPEYLVPKSRCYLDALKWLLMFQGHSWHSKAEVLNQRSFYEKHMWVACSHQGLYSLKLHTFSGQKLPERNESHLLLSLLGLFVSLNINLHNIHPNLQLYCQNRVHKVLQVLSWDRNQGAHLSGPRCIPCHLVGERSTVFMSSSSRRACLKVRTSCL